MSIWTILFVVLLVAWILGWGVFHVAGGLIHLLLILAVISLILHFVRGAAAQSLSSAAQPTSATPSVSERRMLVSSSAPGLPNFRS